MLCYFIGKQYDLHGVIVHRGPNSSNGHHVAYFKDVEGSCGGGWWLFDDANVKACRIEDHEAEMYLFIPVYVYVYQCISVSVYQCISVSVYQCISVSTVWISPERK